MVKIFGRGCQANAKKLLNIALLLNIASTHLDYRLGGPPRLVSLFYPHCLSMRRDIVVLHLDVPAATTDNLTLSPLRAPVAGSGTCERYQCPLSGRRVPPLPKQQPLASF